ncbi:MAG TPA: SufE family protein [Chitinophagaceae bacterium]|jgi:cysteine desulfuration protein SufE|nr:SufE family protein [Chitinophagaceae bacterium]
MKPEIKEIQQEIIDEFSLLQGDMESTIFYIMELGSRLPPLEEKYKKSENLVKGCQSKVWLTTSFEDGKVLFMADSNTDVTKGLISLLVRLWNGRKPEDILQTDLFFIDKIGMNKVIGSQRSNGFASMIKQMKLYALGYQQKEGQVN